jgi:hypothetical protein
VTTGQEAQDMNVDYKQLTQDKAALRETWSFLELSGEYPTKQIPLWLLEYGRENIESAFKVLKAKEDKIADPIAYLATILRNAKKRNMTPEERATEISQMRSVIGKVGNARRHEKEVDALKSQFAEVCND